MRFNTRGEIGLGRDKRWLNDDQFIGQTGNDHDGWNLTDQHGTEIAPGGVFYLAAGGNKWADTGGAVRSNFGYANPAGKIHDIALDGTVCESPDYQEGLRVGLLGGPYVTVAGIREARAHPGGYAVCALDGRIYVSGFEVRIPAGVRPNTAQVVGDCLLYATDRWLVLQQLGTLRGVVVASAPTFYPDGVRMAGGYLIGWTQTQGDTGPQTRLVRPEELSADLSSLSDSENPPPPPPPDVPTLAAFDRKLWIAPFFSFSDRYGDAPIADLLTYSNAVLVVEPGVEARVRAAGQPMIVAAALPHDPVYLDLTVAWWADSEGHARDALALPEKPVIAYLDTGNAADWPATRPDWITDRVWPSVQAYRGGTESLDQFAARMTALLDRVARYGRPMVLTPRFDDFNGSSTVARTVECMALYERYVRDYFIVGFMPFADRRGHGIAQDATLRAWAQAFFRANPTRPNRYDYWLPSGTDLVTVLRNKLMQTTELVALGPEEKRFILERLGEQPPPPPPYDDATPGLTDAQFATLEAVRAEYPEFHEEFPDGDPRRNALTGAQMGAMLNKVCWIHRNDSNKPGMQEKPGNATRTIQPHTGIEIWNGLRFLVRGHHYGQDVLAGASIGRATPYRATPGDADMVADLRVEPVEP